MTETPDTRHPTPDGATADIEDTSADATGSEPSTDNRKPSASRGIIIGLAALIVVLLGVGQFFLFNSLKSTTDEIESLDAQLTGLNSALYDMSVTIDDIAKDAKLAAANNAGGGATPAPAVPDGFLPRFSSDAPDQAVGMVLSTIEGPDGYSDATITIDPTDGTKRVWMVWAHWCPYCQQELPELTAWWPEAQSTYPNSDFITVTTSIDESRGNPLEPYLAESQFPFPVLVDADTKIAAQMGVNAFPFWIVTDADGTVLFRTTGALGIEQVEQLFAQLEEFDA
ncbi:MAG: redoxin domain-containing protein [Actinomycetota bacterium]